MFNRRLNESLTVRSNSPNFRDPLTLFLSGAPMYAIIKTGGKQYRVSEGQTLRVEKLEGETGSSLTIDQVLLIGGAGETKIGTPLVEGAAVQVDITRQAKAKKVIIFKKNRRKGYHKKQGHRQRYTELRVTGITA